MGFNSEWEQRYAENTHMSVWPWSDVVSLVTASRSLRQGATRCQASPAKAHELLRYSGL